MFKYFTIAIVFLSITSHNITASEQFPDLLLYRGQEYEIGVFPMETYFTQYPRRRPGMLGVNTALYRGYRASYGIVNEELLLLNFETLGSNGNWRRYNSMYYRTGMKLTEFSGNINLFNGNLTWVFLGFTPIYDSYIIIEVLNGNVIRVYDTDSIGYLELLRSLHSEDSQNYNYFSVKIQELRDRNY